MTMDPHQSPSKIEAVLVVLLIVGLVILVAFVTSP